MLTKVEILLSQKKINSLSIISHIDINLVIKKYIFYYLQSIQQKLFTIAKKTAQPGNNQENLLI